MKALYQHQQTVTTATPTGPVTLTVEHHYEHSAPMSSTARRNFYRAQNGSNSLTVRQLRAIRKADIRSDARSAALLAGAR